MMLTNNETPPFLIFLLGVVVGTSFYDESETIKFLRWLANLFATLYTITLFVIMAILSFSHIGSNFSRNYDEIEEKTMDKKYDATILAEKSSTESTSTKTKKGIPELVQIETVIPSDSMNQKTSEKSALHTGGGEDSKLQQNSNLIDLNGSYRLQKNTDFLEFLAAQGVGWALRAAANKAITTHHITHKGSMLKIRVGGIINSETVYTIDGPPIQTKVKDRVYMDYVSYLDNGQGIKIHKVNKEHNYTINVVRTFSPDKQILIVTSTASFADGKTVEAIQEYRRLDPNEK